MEISNELAEPKPANWLGTAESPCKQVEVKLFEREDGTLFFRVNVWARKLIGQANQNGSYSDVDAVHVRQSPNLIQAAAVAATGQLHESLGDNQRLTGIDSHAFNLIEPGEAARLAQRCYTDLIEALDKLG